jgi:hypothetical protein
VEYQITCRPYAEHNCSKKHKNKEDQFVCYFSEGFSVRKVRLGKSQPALCEFQGSGDWAVIHALDARKSKDVPQPHTKYQISFFELLDDAAQYWKEIKAEHGEEGACSTQCVGVYPHILTMSTGWPIEGIDSSTDELVWPIKFVKNLYFYERDTNAFKSWINTKTKAESLVPSS